MAYLFWAIDLSGTAQASQGLTVARCAPWVPQAFGADSLTVRQPRHVRVAGQAQDPVRRRRGHRPHPHGRAGRRLKAHAPGLKIVSIVPEILPGIAGLSPLGPPEDILPASV